jgi:hypothetical protein
MPRASVSLGVASHPSGLDQVNVIIIMTHIGTRATLRFRVIIIMLLLIPENEQGDPG